MLSLLVKKWKLRIYYFFHAICKISNFNMWTAKNLVQASCTELTLPGKDARAVLGVFGSSVCNIFLSQHWEALSRNFKPSLQVNQCQKLSFSNQLTHNITTDCSLIPDFSTRKIQLQNMLCTNIVFCFWLVFKTIFVHNMFSICIFRGIQWTISCHIVG